MDSILKKLSFAWVPYNGGLVLRVREKCVSAYVGSTGLTRNIQNATVLGGGSDAGTPGNIFDSQLDFVLDA